jgi:glycosyltransferase involved in cell wall biosynthesis
MKICYIAETVSTGVGRHLADLISAMAARRHDVHFVYSPSRADRALLDEIATCPGVRIFPLPMRREPAFADLRVLAKLVRYLRKEGPFHVIHGHSSKGGAYARLLALFFPAACVYTPHAFITMSSDLTPARRALYRAAEYFLGLLSDAVICVSAVEYCHARSLGLGHHRLSLIMNGLRRLRPQRTPRPSVLPAAGVLIGFVGRFDRQKALEIFVDAAKHVRDVDVPVYFVVIGDGPQRQRLQAQTQQSGLADKFIWLGTVDATEFLPHWDVLAAPSRYEGMSYAMLEALGYGLAIVCTPVGGASEIVQDGHNGFIVPHDDPDSLAQKLQLLVSDTALLRRMQAHSRRHAERFSIDRMATEVEQIYRARGAARPANSAAPNAAARHTTG